MGFSFEFATGSSAGPAVSGGGDSILSTGTKMFGGDPAPSAVTVLGFRVPVWSLIVAGAGLALVLWRTAR